MRKLHIDHAVDKERIYCQNLAFLQVRAKTEVDVVDWETAEGRFFYLLDVAGGI